MRRAAPTLAISPKLLKHFAAATVTITLLLALFATDEDWGARAQLEANQAKNQLAAAEAEKLGTKKLASKLKVREAPGGGFGTDEGGGSGGGGDWTPRKPQSQLERPSLRTHGIPQLEQRPGATVTVTGMDLEDARQPDPRKRKRKTGEQFRPNAEQIDQIKVNSRQRTGGTDAGGD